MNAIFIREDLFYRINVIEIHLPPLRERRDDIPLLFEHFCKKYQESFNKNIQGADESVMKALMNYPWPGNVRELEAMTFNSVSNHKSGKLSMDLFKAHISQNRSGSEKYPEKLSSGGDAPITFADRLPTLKQAEQLLIDEALKRSSGNQSIAALSLGISRQALNKRLQKARQ